MSGCHHLSDRMPEVARAASRWTAEEAAHLVGCAECAAEWRLVAQAATLGAGVGARVRTDQLAERVAARLRAAPHQVAPARPWVRRAVLPVAAAAALISAVWFGWPAPGGQEAPAPLVALLPELDDLDETELETLAEVFTGDDVGPVSPLDATESLGDLSDAELESLLRLMEG